MIHELGHFVAAKLSKMRVEEFAFGFPPSLFKKKKGETTYAFNLLPIGGYVKITGESFDPEEREKLKNDKKAFQNRPRILQLFVLSAGVFMNIILAVFIFTILNSRMHLISASDTAYTKYLSNPKMYVSGVLPNSPAETSGLKAKDEIVSVSTIENNQIKYADLSKEQNVIDFVQNYKDSSIQIVYKNKEGEASTSTVAAVYGLAPEKKSIGLGIEIGQYVKFNIFDAARYAISDTYNYTKLTAIGIKDALYKLMTGKSISESVAGPVGVAKMVGKASESGIDNLLFLTAILSINLAIFNILPIPALDGGRILFVLIEIITRKSLNYKFQYYANAIGFLLLMSLMIFTVFLDINRL